MGNFSNKRVPGLTDEDNILVSHIKDMVRICEKTRKPRFSAFLDERQILIAENAVKSLGFENYSFFGGYEGASRKVLGVFPEYYDGGEDFPIAVLNFSYRSADKLSHRDFLGAFMSRQIKRDMLGDIVVSEGNTAAFVYETVKQTLLSEIDKVGSAGVKVSEGNASDVKAEQSFTEKNGTVSSLRLDSVVSLAAGISRGKAVTLIKGGYVSVMYNVADSPSFMLSEGDIFSVRGAGKFILASVNGTTKKDRIHITVKKYN